MPRGVPKAGFRMTARRILEQTGSVGAIRMADSPVPQEESRFTINERFGFIGDMIRMLVRGDQNSVIVSGPGGLGKSYNVIKALKDAGMTDVTLADDFEDEFVVSSRKSFSWREL